MNAPQANAPQCPQCSTVILSQENSFFRCWRCKWIGQLEKNRPVPDIPMLETLCKSVRFVGVFDGVFGDGPNSLFHPCNPTVAWHDDRLWLLVRFVNYKLGDQGKGPYFSHNAMREIEPDLGDVYLNPIDTAVITNPPNIYQTISRGLEDIRLFSFDGRMLGIACSCDRNPYGRPEQVTFELDPILSRVSSIIQYPSPLAEKNWLPFVEPDRYLFLYALRPTTIVLDSAGREISRQPFLAGQAPDQPMLSGSSQVVPWEGGYLLVAHERFRGFYQHRFILMNDRLQARAMSKPFSFLRTGVEFCCGMAPLPGQHRMLISFGVEDREAWLCTITHNDIERILEYDDRKGQRP